MADNLGGGLGGNLSYWEWGIIGSMAGTAARANDWIDAQNRVVWKMLVADFSASGVVIIVAVLVADWLRLPGPYAAGFSAILTLVGLRVLRAAAIQAVEIMIDGFRRRVGAEPAAPPAPPPEEPKP